VVCGQVRSSRVELVSSSVAAGVSAESPVDSRVTPAVRAGSDPFERGACSSPGSEQFLFYPGAFELRHSGSDAFFCALFSRLLNRMAEPSLSCEPPSADTFRLLLVPAWGAPKAIRITQTRPESFLTVTRGKSSTQVTTAMSPTGDMQRLSEAIARAGFWTMPTFDDATERCRDGTLWLLEGRSRNAYHVVLRGCPTSGPFKDVGLMLLRLAKEAPM
jgi:hypothetical protein